MRILGFLFLVNRKSSTQDLRQPGFDASPECDRELRRGSDGKRLGDAGWLPAIRVRDNRATRREDIRSRLDRRSGDRNQLKADPTRDAVDICPGRGHRLQFGTDERVRRAGQRIDRSTQSEQRRAERSRLNGPRPRTKAFRVMMRPTRTRGVCPRDALLACSVPPYSGLGAWHPVGLRRTGVVP